MGDFPGVTVRLAAALTWTEAEWPPSAPGRVLGPDNPFDYCLRAQFPQFAHPYLGWRVLHRQKERGFSWCPIDVFRSNVCCAAPGSPF